MCDDLCHSATSNLRKIKVPQGHAPCTGYCGQWLHHQRPSPTYCVSSLKYLQHLLPAEILHYLCLSHPFSEAAILLNGKSLKGQKCWQQCIIC